MKLLLSLLLIALAHGAAYSQARTAESLMDSTFSGLNANNPRIGSVRNCINCKRQDGPCQAASVGETPIGSDAMKFADGWMCSARSSSGGSWGDIIGVLSDQSDLQAALDAKAGLSNPTFTGTVTSGSFRSTAGSYSLNSGSTVFVKAGTGSPETNVTGAVGSIWLRTDGGANTSVYRKESGSGNTGWVAVASGISTPGGTDGTVQYNDGGSLGGASSFTFDDGTGIISTNGYIVTATGALRWNGRGRISSPADSVFLFTDSSQIDFSMMKFGGTTSAYPALKRTATSLSFRLADDSADAPMSASTGTFSGAVTAPSYTSSASSAGQITLSEPTGTGSDGVTFKAPASVTTSYDVTMPAAASLGFFRHDGTATVTFVGETGSGNVARPAGSLVIASGKTSTTNNSLTFAGTDATTMTFPEVSASVGFRNIPQNSQSAAYTTVLADSGKHLYHPSADTSARTWTIDSNANVAYAIGTAITFVNDCSAGTLTIAITSDTLVLAGAGTTGSRTLAACGVATAIKVTATRWIISGTNLT